MNYGLLDYAVCGMLRIGGEEVCMDMLIEAAPTWEPCVVNHTTAVRVETLPFGGNKGSGNGREGIHDTLHEMSKEKTLLLHEVFGAVA